METDPKIILKPVLKLFAARKWKAFPYQMEAWTAYLRGESGLISVPTGYGKTLSATLGPISEEMANPSKGLFLLYISPLRALTRDLSQSLQRVLIELGSDLQVECRTGDTSSSAKLRQRKQAPRILFTTPESLSLLLSYPGAEHMFGNLKCVVVDEWHELIAGKRGVQVQLGLARLRKLRPELRVWGLSATLGNLQQAAEALVGDQKAHLIRGDHPKEIDFTAIKPETIDSFPWSGHLGIRLLPQLTAELSAHKSTLIFTNTRWQAERWHRALIETLPTMADQIAIHHSSLDREEREQVEEGLRTGEIKWVVCTSSLDLGVDFQKVEQVVQIGSAKSLARLVQRAGRSQHRPNEPSHLIYLPTNSWELVELEAAKTALHEGVIEPRMPLPKPMDVLVQHLITLACGDGFTDDIYEELRATYSFRNLTRKELDWAINFVVTGGETLQAYPQYQRLYKNEEGLYLVRSHWIARQHRMSIGTITATSQVGLFLMNRKRIGHIEEAFLSKLRRGDVFYFSGRKLEFVMMRDMKAYVKLTRRNAELSPSWAGTQMPLSESLSSFFQKQLAAPPIPYLKDLFEAQERISQRPKEDELLFEIWDSREGRHLFAFPFAGRFVHEGLAAVWTYRFAHTHRATFVFSVNDYGLEIVGPKEYPFADMIDARLLSTENLEEQIESTLNMTEMSLRRFRGIAQNAGLVFSGYPSARKTGKQLQMSSSLLYEVFRKHDPGSLLIQQAHQEVLDQQLELSRIERTLERLQKLNLVTRETQRPSPLGLPLWGERTAARLTTESLQERLQQMKKEWSRWS